MRRLLIVLGILVGLLALADRGAAVAAGNATARQVRVHEGLSEDPKVTFRGFPFVTQAIHGTFRAVDVTVRELDRGGINIDRIDAHLEGVKVNLSKALHGRVNAVPVREGHATVRLTYADIAAYLAGKPGNIRLTVREGQVFVTSTFGIPNVGQVDVEGTPSVKVTDTSVQVVVSAVHVVTGTAHLTAALAASAAARASFTIPLKGLPFGIQVESAALTDTALVVKASAVGLVIDVRNS
jgi:hypothetical protein